LFSTPLAAAPSHHHPHHRLAHRVHRAVHQQTSLEVAKCLLSLQRQQSLEASSIELPQQLCTVKCKSVDRDLQSRLLRYQFNQHFWGQLLPVQESISPTFYAYLFVNILAPKNFKPKTQLCNFWHQNFLQKTHT